MLRHSRESILPVHSSRVTLQLEVKEKELEIYANTMRSSLVGQLDAAMSKLMDERQVRLAPLLPVLKTVSIVFAYAHSCSNHLCRQHLVRHLRSLLRR